MWIVAALTLLVGLATGFSLGVRQISRPQEGIAPTITKAPPVAGLPSEALDLVKARGLTPEDVTSALSTYTLTGKYDEYVMFSSGGHSGQVLVTGLPSMRVLKVIAVFSPEPRQGYGYGVKENAFTPALLDGKDPSAVFGLTGKLSLGETRITLL
ncbi:MAG: hypothetical protein ACUVTP_13120 [Candidatus Fervidibacter sp.]|uniref:hypothetical protein n=1 Tax=Candidatus Fervidibacter sp. TaxID=3100871 RepID=UPI004049DF4E